MHRSIQRWIGWIDRPGPWAIFVKVAVVRFRCDIRHSATITQRGATAVRKWYEKMKNEKKNEKRAMTRVQAQAWGCESKRPGMYGRRIIVTSCSPISQRYPRLCILKAARNRVGDVPDLDPEIGSSNPKRVPYFLSVHPTLFLHDRFRVISPCFFTRLKLKKKRKRTKNE